ncbi:hypothetical protein OEZ85_004379 [Tetradesmus obliquus]|uniref:USP domain-containing protein n=1 Tax=Tetradesmus obliquus TaxID=3088 RepID=A0ABY8UKJ1_TETOB|nr:hypothetical protein OEZ85_004379 [Tetradesmus obliquus]
MEEELAVSNSVSDDDAGQASSEILEQGEDAMDAEQQGKLYPSDEYLMLMSQITNLRTSSHGIYALGQCLRTARGMLRWGSPSSRMRQTDLDCVRRLFRDDLFLSVDKLLSYPQSSMLPHQDQEEVLLETLQLLVATAAHALSYRACLAPGDATAELDSDLVPVAQCMLNLFNMNKKLMLQLADEEVPASSKLFEYADSVPDAWAQRQFSSHADNDDPAAVEEDEEQLEPAVERNRWLVHLVNLFGYLHGFENILQLLQEPDQVGFALLNMMTAVLAQVVDVATDAAHEKFNEIVVPVMQHVSQLVQGGSERLSDHGSDRTYSIFQCLANTNLPRIIAHGPDPQAMLLQLAQVQCAFVCKMLESSSFNKLLSGVRECNRMLRNAADSGSRQCGPTLEMLVGWMADQGIVQRILRTNLHQRQYMQEVQGIMVTLTTNQSLAPEHLDMLWAVTEKEDTYEAVKQHMFDLLAEIASRFSRNQLDMLFAKLQAARQRSTQDTQRLLGLLQHLAASDKEVHMCEKIGDMVWDLTMGDGVHPDVVGVGALANVVKAYKGHLEFGDGLDYVVEMINKCAKQLLEGAGGQVPLLRSIRELLRWLPDEQALKLKGRKLPTMQRAVDDLDQQHSLSTVLVKRLCSSVDQARAALAAAREAAAAAPANAAAQQQPDEEALQLAAMESLRQGAWSYSEVLREHLLTLRYLSLHSNSYFDGRLAERLWDTLMVDPPCREDALPATQAFFKAGFQGAPGSTELFEPSTQTALLESHMVRQDAAKLSYMAARLFVDIFQQVNLESKALGLPQAKAKGTFVQAQRLADIKGLDFIWRVYLSNPDDRIAGTMRNQLLWLYHCSSLQVKSASYKRALIERIVAAMHEAAPALRGPEPAAIEAAGRAVSRCLTLALEAIGFKEMATMPPVPAHRLAWRGTPWALDVSRDGASRLRLASHSNEYVGLLRQRMARQVGCSMQHVRMFCFGHELSNDARTLELPLWDSKNRSIGTATNRAVVTAVVSPEPNAYSLAPAEFRSVYEQVSMSWMLAQAEGAKAALELLSELMGDSPSSLEEGVALLIDLHYQQQTLRGWNMSPRPLRAPGQYMGLKNGGATCYMNAVFQQLFMQPAIRAGVLGAAAVEPSEAPDSVFAQLQSMFAMMALGRSTFFIPRDFWGAFKDYDGSPIDVKEHQDAYEFFTRLQDGVDQHLIAAGQPPAIAAVMGGRFVQQIICTGQPFSSERVEEFYQISVDVKGMGSLGRSLDDYVKGELMEGDNAYFCEELGRRVPAVKRSAIKALPQLLCIHLKRFEFDYHNQTRYKVRDRFEFPLEIDMYKYTADGLAAADAQQKAAEQQQDGQQQQQRRLDRQGSEASQQQDGGGTTRSGGGGGGPLPRQLSDAVSGKPAAAASGSSSGGGSSSDEFMYDLMGVVVHSGSAFTGHYYSYIKERRQAAAAAGGSSKGAASSSSGGRWYAFDDKSVTPWDIKELELECFGGKPSQDFDSRGSRPASPGPSSRRGEEADAVAQALLRLGVLFQFQVALRASDVLRSESHVWSEALTSLMGSGPSSSSCMQLFLELAVNHPDWLQLFLVDADNERVPLAPRNWAVNTLGWLLDAAGKRCARQLADYVAQMLRLGSIFGGAGAAGSAASSQQQQQLPAAAWADAAQALRAQQPPLAQAVMAFVERVAELIRDCVPTKHRASSSSAGGGSAAGGGSNGNGLPEVPEIPADAARVLLRYAQLGPWAAAHLMQVLQVVPDVADILAAFVAAAEPDEDMLLEDVAPLYDLLAELVSEVVIRAAGTALCKSLHSHPAAQDQGGGANARMVEAMRKHLALMVLQPDSFAKDRCAFLLTGSYASAAAAARSGSVDGSSSSMGAAAPGIAVWVEAVSWPCVGFFKFLGGFFEDLRGWQGPQDAGMLSRHLARAVFETGYIYEAGVKLVGALKGNGEYVEVLGAVQVVLTEAQAAAKERQAVVAAAAAGSSGVTGGGAGCVTAVAPAAGGSGSGGAGGAVSQ